MAVLIWFQVVWIIGPLVGNADGAREIKRETELRKKLLETTYIQETELTASDSRAVGPPNEQP